MLMRFVAIITTLLVLLSVSGCTSKAHSPQPAYAGFEYPHQACYAYWKGANGVEKNLEKAIGWCKRGHEMGQALSSALMGEILIDGRDMKRDFQQAKSYFEAASLLGDTDSSYQYFVCAVGAALEEITPATKADFEKAENHLQLASDQGSRRAAEVQSWWQSKKRKVYEHIDSVFGENTSANTPSNASTHDVLRDILLLPPNPNFPPH